MSAVRAVGDLWRDFGEVDLTIGFASGVVVVRDRDDGTSEMVDC